MEYKKQLISFLGNSNTFSDEQLSKMGKRMEDKEIAIRKEWGREKNEATLIEFINYLHEEKGDD